MVSAVLSSHGEPNATDATVLARKADPDCTTAFSRPSPRPGGPTKVAFTLRVKSAECGVWLGMLPSVSPALYDGFSDRMAASKHPWKNSGHRRRYWGSSGPAQCSVIAVMCRWSSAFRLPSRPSPLALLPSTPGVTGRAPRSSWWHVFNVPGVSPGILECGDSSPLWILLQSFSCVSSSSPRGSSENSFQQAGRRGAFFVESSVSCFSVR